MLNLGLPYQHSTVKVWSGQELPEVTKVNVASTTLIRKGAECARANMSYHCAYQVHDMGHNLSEYMYAFYSLLALHVIYKTLCIIVNVKLLSVYLMLLLYHCPGDISHILFSAYLSGWQKVDGVISSNIAHMDDN